MDETHSVFYLKEVLIILAIAGIFVPLLHKLKFSSVLGYLICGLLAGPYGIGLAVQYFPAAHHFTITDLEWVRGLAEFGVMLLLFTIGLELSFSRLWNMRRLVLGLGSLQILITTAIITWIALLFENSLQTSLLLGACLALSSTSIVVQLLREQHRFSTPVGTTCFSILLMQDIAVVPILILLTVFSSAGDAAIYSSILEALVKAAFAIAAIYFCGRMLLRPLFKYLGFSHNAEWFMAVVLFIVIGAAAITYASGLSLALGAFLAGLLLSETEYRHEVGSVVEPLKGLFLGIFFISVGMVTDPREILREPFWLLVSVIGIFMIKATIIAILSKPFGLSWPKAVEAGLLLGQGGEFAFMIVGMAMGVGLISMPHGQFFMLIAALSMMATPSMSLLAQRLGHYLERWFAASDTVPKTSSDGRTGHVIIAGFGRVGKLLGEVLEREQIAYVAMDNSSPRVGAMRDNLLPVYYGDARRADLWKKLDVERANAALITVDDPGTACAILHMLRKHWPNLTVVARAHDATSLQQLYESGATLVVQETLEATLQLARLVLEKLHVPGGEIETVIAQSRGVAEEAAS